MWLFCVSLSVFCVFFNLAYFASICIYVAMSSSFDHFVSLSGYLFDLFVFVLCLFIVVLGLFVVILYLFMVVLCFPVTLLSLCSHFVSGVVSGLFALSCVSLYSFCISLWLF